MTEYLIRLDDCCPTMRKINWDRAERLLIENGIKPVVAVIPDNRDTRLIVDRVDSGFWGRMRFVQEMGWTIAQHGYQHLNHVSGESLIPLHRKSEFAGLAADEQFQKIRLGYGILRSQGLRPAVWVAPRHGFDMTTVTALRALGITCISDGFDLWPSDRDGVMWIPQQLWGGARRRWGVWTICVHLNDWTESQFLRLEDFVRRYRTHFVSVPEICSKYKGRNRSVLDQMLNVYLLKRYRLTASISKSERARRIVRFMRKCR